ncbi:hypothetical protein BpHYR1_039927 [Brachionus plicatilis]|uniref:KRAB-A domain-containing 2-like n=1 Tax=Brachionus plicatilis TaxID=10195 RepID=A0A3M7SK89_BRAPC|nr:hypothetical protein BpHYR1_039927 [Brachionus plicatilis]
MADIQQSCNANLRNAAEKMAQQHINKLGEAMVGDTVQVPDKLLKFEALDLTKERSLREINGLHSISGGQGFLKCNCSGKCERNCTCKKNGIIELIILLN